MKKCLLVISLFAMTTIAVMAQQITIKFGVKAGLNISGAQVDNAGYISGVDVDVNSRAGGYAGGYARIPLVEKLTLQPELLYSLQGVKRKASYMGLYSSKETFSLSYINIPVMLQYEFVKGFRGEFGPQFGFLVAARDKWSEGGVFVNLFPEGEHSGSENVKNWFKTFDFGLNLGLNYELDNGLNFGVRYNLGLTNIAKGSSDEGGKVHNGAFSVGLGYTF